MIAVIAITAAIVTFLRVSLEPGALCVIAVTLMVSANCHPWYLIWMLPLLAFEPITVLVLWTILAPLAYHAIIGWTLLGEWSTPVRWYEYVPVYGPLAGSWLVRAVRRTYLAGARRA